MAISIFLFTLSSLLLFHCCTVVLTFMRAFFLLLQFKTLFMSFRCCHFIYPIHSLCYANLYGCCMAHILCCCCCLIQNLAISKLSARSRPLNFIFLIRFVSFVFYFYFHSVFALIRTTEKKTQNNNCKSVQLSKQPTKYNATNSRKNFENSQISFCLLIPKKDL